MVRDLLLVREAVLRGPGSKNSYDNALHMHHIVICGLSDLQYFYTLSHKRYDFRKRIIEGKMYVFLYKFVGKFFILRRIKRNVIKNVYCLLRNFPIILIIIL